MNKNLPATAAQVRDRLLKFKQGGPSVEEAKAAMLAAKEAAVTTRMGAKVPQFIEEESGRGRGGNVPVRNTAVIQHAELLASARKKIAALKIPQGKRVNLDKMRDAGMITQPEIDALLLDKEGKAPNPDEELSEEVLSQILEEEPTPTEPTRVPVTPPISEVPIETPPVELAQAPLDSRKTVETKKFTGQIFKDGKEWVAELVYKNGSGTERFTASNKDDLMLKVLEGKGYGTVKVRETVQRYKVGDTPDDWDYFFKQMKESHGLTVEQFNALPEASRDSIQDTIQTAEAITFQENYPEYYNSAHNWQLIMKFLGSRKWPLTVHNLELAYRELGDEDLLESRPKTAPPPEPQPQVSAPANAPVPVDSGTAVPSPAPAAPAASAAEPTAPAVRKRVSTGLIPGSSSAAPENPAPKKTEDGDKPQELSETELRRAAKEDLSAFKRQWITPTRKYGVRY